MDLSSFKLSCQIFWYSDAKITNTVPIGAMKPIIPHCFFPFQVMRLTSTDKDGLNRPHLIKGSKISWGHTPLEFYLPRKP
jgi:hypothetical protein